MIPRVKDKLLVGLVTKEFGRYFAKRGATVYEYTPGFIHQKSATADGKMCIIGSANLDQRSFYHNFECGVTLYDSDISRQVERDFTLISELSERINAEEKMTVISAFFSAVGRFISSLL